MTSAYEGVTIAIPGGMAGQVFGVAHALWYANKTSRKIHVCFHDMGTEISNFSVGEMLESATTKNLQITFSTEGLWPPATNSILENPGKNPAASFFETWSLFGGLSQWTRRVLKPKYHRLAIHKEKLLSAGPGQQLIGYPSDLAIVEESWPLLSQALSETSYPNFIQDAGSDPSVAIHWRLGDYIGSDLHGVVTWDSIYKCMTDHNFLKKDIRIYTDSPELAAKMVARSEIRGKIEIFSNAIWSDLHDMTRSKFFIGTNSQVSLLAAISLAKSRNRAVAFLPKPFFNTPKWRTFFHPPPKTRVRFRYYRADFADPPEGGL